MPAQANCTINGVSSSANVVDLVPEDGQVVCDTGVLVQGFNGRTDRQLTTPANQFDAEIRSGATLVAPGPGAQNGGSTTDNDAVLFFGPWSTAVIVSGLTVWDGERLSGEHARQGADWIRSAEEYSTGALASFAPGFTGSATC